MKKFKMISYTDELYHHGIKGQKRGVRRYQNEDGSLTAKGIKRYKKGRLRLEPGFKVDSNYKVDYERDKTGKLTKAGTKAWYKYDPESGDMLDDELDAMEAYSKTQEGKKRYTEYDKQMTRMYDDPDWDGDEKAMDAFNKAEESYLRGQKEYAAKKLIEKYGQEKANIYANKGNINTGKDAVAALSDEWWLHAF